MDHDICGEQSIVYFPCLTLDILSVTLFSGGCQKMLFIDMLFVYYFVFQSRTDRIVFKLFGKNPNDFPLVLRSQVFSPAYKIAINILLHYFFVWFLIYVFFAHQILTWLSHSPTEIESYIRPGCIILTIYLRLENSAWEEV